MTPRDEALFMQGLLLGAALVAHAEVQKVESLDKRVQQIENAVRPQRRLLRRLVPMGWRDGQRIFRIVG